MTQRTYTPYPKWNDYQCIPYAFPAGASAPDLVAIGGGTSTMQGYAFDGNATSEQLFGQIEILHDYSEGTDIYPHVHWCPTTTGAGDVLWLIDYSLISPTGVFPASVQTCSMLSTASGVAWKHQLNECLNPISGTGVKIGSIFSFRVYRTPAAQPDTYGSDAVLLSVGLHVQVNTPGSSLRFTK